MNYDSSNGEYTAHHGGGDSGYEDGESGYYNAVGSETVHYSMASSQEAAYCNDPVAMMSEGGYCYEQQQQQEGWDYSYGTVLDASSYGYSGGQYSMNSGEEWHDDPSLHQNQDYPLRHHPQEWGLGAGTGEITDATVSFSHQLEHATPGSFALESSFSPPQLFGHAAVTSLSHDLSYNCLYLASTTQTVSSTRFHTHRASLLLSCNTKVSSPHGDDAPKTTMMDGLVPYSCVAGHPEAPPSILDAIYESVYGISRLAITGPASSTSQQLRRGGNNFFPPPHAYTPPYGGSGSIGHPHHYPPGPSPSSLHRQQIGHKGISDLLPLEGGLVASISPSAVRVHSYGGLQVHDHDVEGMLCGSVHPNSGGGAGMGMGPTHISVAGISLLESTTATSGTRKYQTGNSMYCFDLWQGLRTVYSRSFSSADGARVGITAMQTNFEKGSIACGSTDGKVRILDASLREVATVRSHQGGVSSMAISPDGTLIATTGFSSKPSHQGGGQSALFAYPDLTVLLYDIRYLGRGGIPHPFAGVKGAPRHVRFVPNVDGCAPNRFLVASGKPGGGVQIVVPFESQIQETSCFFLPPLEQGEFMTAISDDSEVETMALGTSLGRILKYRMVRRQSGDFVLTRHSCSVTTPPHAISEPTSTVQSSNEGSAEKAMLPTPLFGPQLPPLSIDPSILQGDPSLRRGATEATRAIFGAYVMQTDPTITRIGNSAEESMTTFGAIAGDPILGGKRRTVSLSLLKEATVGEYEFMVTIPIVKLGVDLMENQNIVSTRYKGNKLKDPTLNPNKLLYNDKLSAMCYQEWKRKQTSGQIDTALLSDINSNVPARYQLPLRSGYSTSGAFDPSDYNDTGLFPGWDYGTNMPNEWASPVLQLFYFIPEIRSAVLAAQFSDKTVGTRAYDKALTPELGFVFHQMESLSRYGLLYPSKHKRLPKKQPFHPKIGAWVPSNFLTSLATMPEVENLQVLDGSPAAIDRPRRPESFYRFLALQLDKELSSIAASSSSTKTNPTESRTTIMDALSGFNFLSSNQFIESRSSPPTSSVTRALTLDLNYDMFPPGSEKKAVRFGELLQHSLCRETRLRAWNEQSQEYETIIQRKIAASLPQILTLSCACAGRKYDDGLWAWRSDCGDDPWLPEIVEVQLEADGNVTVSEWHAGKDGSDVAVFQGKTILPPEVSKVISESSSRQKCRYRLEAVLAFVADCDGEDTEKYGNSGHHVLHARVPLDYKLRVLKNQIEEARKLSMTTGKKSNAPSDDCSSEARDFVLSASVTADDYEARATLIEKQLLSIEREMNDKKGIQESEWMLYNGYKVASTVVEDARAFHVSFKQPVLVVFRSVDEKGVPFQSEEVCVSTNMVEKRLPPIVLSPRNLAVNTSSNTGGVSSKVARRLKGGRPLAFDAEFVSVQEEEWALTESGQKQVLRETRHALGRISVFDCPSSEVIVDDHVLPRERVVDFLTRFSGIVSDDLDPICSTKKLISTRSAYLELRYLLEQGCIFVGHGLKQDFYTVNLVVPPSQILDTVEIFHQPGMRNVSLRFLANYVLGRDIQEDIHNSVEDAKAAYELYQQALIWKREGVWEERLRELYAYGEETSWKLGADKGKLMGKNRC